MGRRDGRGSGICTTSVGVVVYLVRTSVGAHLYIGCLVHTTIYVRNKVEIGAKQESIKTSKEKCQPATYT